MASFFTSRLLWIAALLVALAGLCRRHPPGKDDGENARQQRRKGEDEDDDPLEHGEEQGARAIRHHPAEQQGPRRIDRAAHHERAADLQRQPEPDQFFQRMARREFDAEQIAHQVGEARTREPGAVFGAGPAHLRHHHIGAAAREGEDDRRRQHLLDELPHQLRIALQDQHIQFLDPTGLLHYLLERGEPVLLPDVLVRAGVQLTHFRLSQKIP